MMLTCCHLGAARTAARPGQQPSGSHWESGLAQSRATAWTVHSVPLPVPPAPVAHESEAPYTKFTSPACIDASA